MTRHINYKRFVRDTYQAALDLPPTGYEPGRAVRMTAVARAVARSASVRRAHQLFDRLMKKGD